MIYKLATLTTLLILAVPALAGADSASIIRQGEKSRLTITLDSFADRGRLRIVSVQMRYKNNRWNLGRDKKAKTWVSEWSRRATLLPGKKITIYVKRRNNNQTRRLLIVPSQAVSPTPDQPQQNPEPDQPQQNPEPDQPQQNPEPDQPEEIAPGINATGLKPKWSPEISDFTALCPDNKINFAVNEEMSVSIDNEEARQGAWKQEVSISTGQETTIKAFDKVQHVRCRPADMPMPEVQIYSKPKAEFHLVAPTLGGGNYLMVIDQQGVPVWWYKDAAGTPLDFKVIDSSTFSWVRGVGPFSSLVGNSYDLRGLGGDLKSTVTPVGYGADHHDLQPTSDGGWLFLIYAPRDCPNTPSECEDLSVWGGPSQANVIDGIVQKIDSEGNKVWEWNSRDHIALEESAPWIAAGATRATLPNGSSAYDIIHLNSVESDGGDFVFSARHLNAVYRVDSESGNIDWKLGGVARPESLTVDGDPLGGNPLAGQHDARVLPDGSLTVHDNGTLASRPPRMVHYRLSPGSADLIGSIQDTESAPGSYCCGGGRLMNNGNWVVSWGANSVSAEYDDQGNPVMRLSWPAGLFSYRSVPAADGLLTASDLRQGMSRQFPR